LLVFFETPQKNTLETTFYLPAMKPALLYKGQTRIRRKTDGGQITTRTQISCS